MQLEIMTAVVKKLVEDPERLQEFERARWLAKRIVKQFKEHPFKHQPPHIVVAALYIASLSFVQACLPDLEDETRDNH